MKAFLLSWPLLMACSLASAESAANVEPLPDAEFMKIMEDYTVLLSEAERQAVLEAIADLPSDELPQVRVFRQELAHPQARLKLKDVLELTTDRGPVVNTALAQNSDPLLQYIACMQLIIAGDSEAAQTIYKLIHDESLSEEHQRLLATWCQGVGIRVKTDTADSIFEFIKTAMGDEPKFKPGDAAPDFEATDTGGQNLNLKNLAGRYVVLHFWSTSCGPCMGEMDTLKAELIGYSPLQVEIIFVSLDSDRQKFDEAIKKLELPAGAANSPGPLG
jgi:thiol-disulfide isomerase/thioredoxin